jgi:hypothetical protein
MTGPARHSAVLKQVELMSAAGVFVLGAGAGAWFGDELANYAVALLVGGGLLHGVAMYGKHRLEAGGPTDQPVWYRWLYWLCWALLAMLAAWLILTRA